MGSISISSVLAGTAGSTPAASTTSSSSGTDRSSLRSEDFMTLLIAQLKNQDPDSPMDTTAMMQQTTQMAEMEQLTSLSSTTTSSYALQQKIAAAGLVGDTVSYTGADGTSSTGTVSAVNYLTNGATLTVGSSTVDLSAVTSVTKP